MAFFLNNQFFDDLQRDLVQGTSADETLVQCANVTQPKMRRRRRSLHGPLSPQTAAHRRLRNRECAKLCRDRKRLREQQRLQENKELKQQNARLQVDMANLKREKRKFVEGSLRFAKGKLG